MKMRTRRTSIAVGTVTLAALALSACSGGGGSAESAPDEPVEPVVWAKESGAEDVAAAFNASQDEVEVVWEQGGDYTMLRNAIEAGTAPDVATVEYMFLPEFATQGQLVDVSDVAADFNDANFPAAANSMVTLGDRTWGVPLDVAPMVLLYRKDLFDQAGIAAPFTTWAEFAEAAEEFKDEFPDKRITSFWFDDVTLMQGLCWQKGQPWFSTAGDAWDVTINSPGCKEAGAFFEDLVARDLVWNQNAWGEEWNKSLAEGTNASYISAVWAAGGLTTKFPDQSGNWAIAPLPTWEAGGSGAMLGGTSYTIPTGIEESKIDAAMKYIEFATTSTQAWQQRVESAENPSSALPANADAREVAAAAFTNTAFFGGQDVFTFNASQIENVTAPWIYGPDFGVEALVYTDNAANGVSAALDATQQSSIDELTRRGLTLAS